MDIESLKEAVHLKERGDEFDEYRHICNEVMMKEISSKKYLCKKNIYEKLEEILDDYIALKNMYKYACRYVNENEVPEKENVLRGMQKYFSKRKRKLDNKCRKLYGKSLLGVILEFRPHLLDDGDVQGVGMSYATITTLNQTCSKEKDDWNNDVTKEIDKKIKILEITMWFFIIIEVFGTAFLCAFLNTELIKIGICVIFVTILIYFFVYVRLVDLKYESIYK